MSLALFELEKTFHLHETPLWSNMDDIFYPQDYKYDGKTNCNGFNQPPQKLKSLFTTNFVTAMTFSYSSGSHNNLCHT